MKQLWSAAEIAAWPKGGDGFVEAFAKGLAVMSAFEGAAGGLTMAEAARRTGLTRAGARRMLHTLVALGLARQDPTGRFALTSRVLRLGYSYLSSLDIAERARPVVEALSAATNETVAVSVLDGGEVTFVARADVARILRNRLSVGSRLPAFCTSMGRVLLTQLAPEALRALLAGAERPAYTPQTLTGVDEIAAEIARVKAQGWALVSEELEPGACGIAAPIRDAQGHVVAALNLSTNLARTSRAALEGDLLAKLLEAAEGLSASAG
ncbi:IclR family transcriptional regulator C-terminal domain-containing protein [Xanthobacter sp. KR7-225]|uniref:IclR family transcriptional regulator domain-containing protein n=1 Tax=Xanthobacter sp. KR7-225 TaxID=3156613 RepID=UPI0032B61657